MVILRICDVDCYYGSVKVLDKVSFSIDAGDLVGLLGPNGSGKTTLLRAISRTLKPKVGTIFLNEADVYSMKSLEVARNLAVVPQNAFLAFDFTALDIVLMGRNPHLSRFERESPTDLTIAKEAMELTNSWHLAEKPINELSGGERQLVMIARALAQEPKVLLLDEPTSHLDINNQIAVMDLLRRICEEKKIAALAVFQDFNLAARYCDSAIMLSKGKIFALGPVEKVLTEKNIAKVFHVNVQVRQHPITDTLYVLPISVASPKIKPAEELRIHVVCGGGTGASLMKLLYEKGCYVTTGVLNLLDTDNEAASALGIQAVSEAPFSPITSEAHKKNLEMIEKADVVVLTNAPFGFGNLKNLEAVATAREKKKFVILVEQTPIRERDFTGGKAQKIFQKLKKNAVVVKSDQEVLLALENFEMKKRSQRDDGNGSS
jgi:iron complex transport system ATP-binding protein